MFKDHFSEGAESYGRYRPCYPDELFAYLAEIAPARHTAWDCACGSGQASPSLARFFERVIATDASSRQIERARPCPGVEYRVATAEHSTLTDEEADLICVAQALHWFDLPLFFQEVDRVLKKEGILAVWTYNLLSIDTAVDRLIRAFYDDVLGSYWPAERKEVENGYCRIDFPYQLLSAPTFAMHAFWDVRQLCGYLETWSAVRLLKKQEGPGKLEQLFGALRRVWGEADSQKLVIWPLRVLVCKKMV